MKKNLAILFIFFSLVSFSQKPATKYDYHFSAMFAPAYSYRYFFHNGNVPEFAKNYRKLFNEIEKPFAGFTLDISIDYTYKRFGIRFGTILSDYAYSYSGAAFEYSTQRKLEFLKFDENYIQHRIYNEFMFDVFYKIIKKKKYDFSVFFGQCAGKPVGENISLGSRGGVYNDNGAEKYYFFYTYYLNDFFSGSRTGIIFNWQPDKRFNLKFETGYSQTVIGGTDGYTGVEYSFLIYAGVGMRYFVSGK